MVPSGSIDEEASKVTVFAVFVGLGEIVKPPFGGRFEPPGSSVTSPGVSGWTPMSEKTL